LIRRERLIGFLFIAPATAVISLFVFWPATNTFITSLHDAPLTQQVLGDYTGWQNYDGVLHDADFARSARNTAIFALLAVPLQTALALFLAVWVNGPGFSRRVLRLSIFIPTTLSLTVMAVLWDLLLQPASATGSGLINGFLQVLHLPTQPFLSSPKQALLCIVAVSVWQGVGLQMMIFLAGLQQIPNVLYESAQLDGANEWNRFWHVTLPALAPTAVFVVMITTIFALKLFVQPYLMTQGGPQGSTISLVQYIYEVAFLERDLGMACAAGAVFFVGVCVIAFLQRLASRWAEAMT
jgi:ABC-type sugar transport system permease subunit